MAEMARALSATRRRRCVASSIPNLRNLEAPDARSRGCLRGVSREVLWRPKPVQARRQRFVALALAVVPNKEVALLNPEVTRPLMVGSNARLKPYI
eukprot:5263572-Pleurochrysis_carterae.AAC.1